MKEVPFHLIILVMVRKNIFLWSVIPNCSVSGAYFGVFVVENLVQSSRFLLMFLCSFFDCFDVNLPFLPVAKLWKVALQPESTNILFLIFANIIR